MKLLALLLVVLLCVNLVPEYSGNRDGATLLNAQHRLINQAAGQLDLAALADFSEASDSSLERGYIEYRLALAAEAQGHYRLMWASLDRAEKALTDDDPKRHQIGDTQALLAAIHLRRMLHSEDPEPHRQALEKGLTLAYLQEPDNPGVLLVSAMAAHYSPGTVGGGQALEDLMLREADAQFARRCRKQCRIAEQAYIWQGLAQSMDTGAGVRDARLIAQSNCGESTGS